MKLIQSRQTPMALAVLIAAGGIAAPQIAWTQESMALEEVVVTARRREENMQQVPIAVSVITGKDLLDSGGLKIDTIGKMAPNVHFEAAGGTSGVKSPIIFIRGMGQNDFIPVEDPAVGIYVDGVYMGRNIGSVFDLIDIERVEVLRGPQGTLFGRNTIGGAINIVSAAPSDEFGGSVQFSAGSDGYLEGKATVNVPFGERAGGRFIVFKRERDGYVRALQYDDLELGSDDSWGARARINADLTDNFNLDIVFDYTEANETPGAISPVAGIGGFNGSTIQLGLPVQPFAHFYNAIWSGNAASCTTAAGQAGDTSCYGPVWNTGDPYAVNSVYTDNDGNKIVPEQDVEVMGGAITLTWNIGDLELKSITGYREFDIGFYNELDFSPYILFANNHD
ncbi:MAG: TonB-dependent receptor plug domain-containing protein, partial [Halieaceae bacterium]